MPTIQCKLDFDFRILHAVKHLHKANGCDKNIFRFSSGSGSI